MKKILLSCLIIAVTFVFSGCASIYTYKAEKDGDPKGIRVYPTRVYLIVTAKETEVRFLPDHSQPYDIRPFALLSKNFFDVSIKNGQIKYLGYNSDTTDILGLLTDKEKSDAQKGYEGGKLREPDKEDTPEKEENIVIEGTLGLKPGIYIVDNDGNIKKVNSFK